MQILALKVGVDNIRAAVVDAATGQIAGRAIDAKCDVSGPASEVAPETLWATVASTARQACRDFPNVAGIGLSVQTPTLVLLDKKDQPLLPLWTSQDRRARPAARQVWAGVGDEFLATTGSKPLPGETTAVGFRQQLNDDPYLGHDVRWYLHLNGWLALRMTGERAFDPGNASRSGLFGTLTDRQWSSRWCDYFEVNKEWLPPVVDGRTTVGNVRTAVAAELGVAAGIPVKLGTLAPAGAMLGANMTSDELWHEVNNIQSLTAICPPPKSSPVANPHAINRLTGLGDSFIQTSFNPVSATALRWIRSLCFADQSEEEFFQATLPTAVKHATQTLFDPPCLSGDQLAIEGYRAAFRDLTLDTNRHDLLAALVQSLLRGHQAALDALGTGRTWTRIVMTGPDKELLRPILPGYAEKCVELIDDGTLRGVAELFTK